MVHLNGSKFIPKTKKVGLVPDEKKRDLMQWKNPQPGETLYEVDTKAKKIRPAEFEKVPNPLPFIRGLVLPKYVLKKEGVVYIAAKDRNHLVAKLVERGIIKVKTDGDTKKDQEVILPKGKKAGETDRGSKE